MLERIRSYSKIRRDVCNAAEYVEHMEGGQVLDTTIEQQYAAGNVGKELGDGDIIPWDEEIGPVAPNVIRVSTLHELGRVYEIIQKMYGGFDVKGLEEGIRHEGAHMEVVSHLEFCQRAFEVEILRSRRVREGGVTRTEISTRPLTRQAAPRRGIAKLEAAALAARPLVLAEGDERYLRSLGYPGLQLQVAHHIRAAKDPRLASLPLPGGL